MPRPSTTVPATAATRAASTAHLTARRIGLHADGSAPDPDAEAAARAVCFLVLAPLLSHDSDPAAAPARPFSTAVVAGLAATFTDRLTRIAWPRVRTHRVRVVPPAALLCRPAEVLSGERSWDEAQLAGHRALVLVAEPARDVALPDDPAPLLDATQDRATGWSVAGPVRWNQALLAMVAAAARQARGPRDTWFAHAGFQPSTDAPGKDVVIAGAAGLARLSLGVEPTLAMARRIATVSLLATGANRLGAAALDVSTTGWSLAMADAAVGTTDRTST